MSITVKKLEEQWTATTIQAAFAFYSQSSSSSSAFYSPYRYSSSPRNISVNLPALNLAWTFALSLTETYPLKSGTPCNYIPAAFSFRRENSKISWGNTRMHAQLSLAMDNNVGSNSTPLGALEDVILAHTPSTEVPLTTSSTLSLLQSTKVSLIVTISECPFADGFFEALSSQFNDTETQARLVTQSGDRHLSRSLTTGNLFDVKFLTRSTRSASGNAGELFETYASLPVLEKHVNLSSAKLREGWTSALAALDHRGNADAKHVVEILCPDDYEYELDSDFEDEDEASPPVELCGSSPLHGRNLATMEGQNLETSTDKSSSPLSSCELGGASGQGSFENLHEEVIKGSGEPPHPSLVVAADHKRTILVKFAAYRTWYAFVWYCYSGRLNFSKLKSQVEPGTRPLPVTHLEDGPPSCSPKSMYRLADLIDDIDLKAKALAAIKERMSAVNVLDETFSVFTSKYPDVRGVQLSVLMGHTSSSPQVKTAFLRAISKFSNMPHAEPALSALYDRLTGYNTGYNAGYSYDDSYDY